MKNFALLLSSLTVTASAFAVAPEVNKTISASKQAPQESVQMSVGVLNGEKVLVKENMPSFKVGNKVVYKAEGSAISYDEPEGLFALGLTEDFYGYSKLSMRKGPAFTPLTWVNTSVGASDFEWEYSIFVDRESIFEYQTTTDLTRPEIWSQVSAPTLYGVDTDGNLGSYQKGLYINEKGEEANNILYYYGGGCDGGDDENGMCTYMNSFNEGYTRFGSTEYNPGDTEYNDPVTGLMKGYTDPEIVGLIDPTFLGYANYFHAPAAPYYINKMWCWMFFQTKRPTTVEIELYKLDEDGNITDELLAKGSTSARANKEESKMLVFDLFALDEDGLEIDDPITIDCAFLAVMKVNKDDFKVINSIAGAGNLYDAEEDNPYVRNAMIVVEENGEVRYLRSPWSFYTDETYSTLSSVSDFMWMVDAVFPWTYEINGKNVAEAPLAGGDVTFTFDSWFDLSTVRYSLPEECDWIDFETASIDMDADNNQVLTLPVAALPEGVEGRQVDITIEAPATNVVITVCQGENAAVNVVVAEGETQYFDLAGRRVANPDKGIYIKKTGNKAEKVVF